MTTATLEHERVMDRQMPARVPEVTTGARYGQEATPSLFRRACDAAVRYLTLKGYEILDRDWECDDGDCIDIVCKDIDGTLVIVDVNAAVDCFPREECIRGRRARLEAMAISYLAERDNGVDMPIRFDSVGIVPVGENRAALRHHVNALGAM